MKKTLLLLLFTAASYGQAVFDEGIQIKNNTTDNTATKVNVQSTDGTINTISKADLVNVVEVNDVPSLPLVGEVGKIYVVKNVNKIYRWNGTFYQELAVTDISGKLDKNTPITAATKTKITYDAKGLVTAGGDLLASDIPTISQSQVANLTTDLATKVDKIAGKELSTEDYTTAEKTKLSGIQAGATANSTDAQLRDRTTHTGTQAISTVTGLQTALDGKVDKAAGERLINASEITKLSNQSGTNTGDQTLSGLGGVASNTAIMGATNTKITYDSKGLVISGTSLIASDVPTLNQNTTGTASTITGNIAESQVTNLVSDLAGKQNSLNGGTGIVKSTAGTISYLTDNSTNWNTAFGWGNHAGLYPTYNGTGATGIWPISISGNSTTASNLTGTLSSSGNNPDTVKTNGLTYFANATNSPANYFQALTMGGSDYSQIGVSSGNDLFFRFNTNNTPTGWRKVLHENNYNNYSPTLSGGGATGTWGISISGDSNSIGGFSSTNILKWIGTGITNASSVPSNSIGYTSSATNMPNATNSWLQTYNINASDYAQIAYNYGNTTGMFYRQVNSGVPLNWDRVITASQLGSNAYNSNTYLPIYGYSSVSANTFLSPGIYSNEAVGGSFPYSPIIVNRISGTGSQINVDYYTGYMRVRGIQTDGSFTPWREMWHNGNFNPSNYLPLTGGTLSGALNGTTAAFTDKISNTSGGINFKGANVSSNTIENLFAQAAVNIGDNSRLLFGTSNADVRAILQATDGRGAARTFTINAFGGEVSVGTSGVNSLMVHGNLRYSGSLSQVSDIRVKKNIRPLNNSLDKITKINCYTYDRTDDGSRDQMGVIAQELEKIYPELITTGKYGEIEDFKTVNYSGLVPALIEAVKEQQKTIDKLNSRIEILEGR